MAAQELHNVYQVGVSEKVKEMEVELEHELAELRTELEEVDLPFRTTSSVPLPENPEHFKRERKLVIQRVLEVSGSRHVCIQAEQMKTEMNITELDEYTPGSLPLLLLQHFSERIQHLLHLRHQYMLRWRRFSRHTSAIEALYPDYSQRLQQILDEYRDSVQRAQRLSLARETLMLHKPESAVTAVSVEDLLIYLRWLVCHLHSVKKFHQFLKVLQWLPTVHKDDLVPPDVSSDDKEAKEEDKATHMASRYYDNTGTHKLADTSRRVSMRPDNSTTSVLHPSPPNPILLTAASVLPSSALLYAVAASGGGLASEERPLSVPVCRVDLEYFRPQLAFLIDVYKIDFDISQVNNSADQMQLFAAINRSFKHIFAKQEQLDHLRTYGLFESAQQSTAPEDTSYVYKKDANWCQFIKLCPETDSQQQRAWAELQGRKFADELLKVEAHFVNVKHCKKVQDTLKKHAAQVQNPQPVATASVTSHRTQENTRVTWKKIYSDPELYNHHTEQDESILMPDFDDRDLENVNFDVRSDSAHKRKDSYDYVSTVQMLGLDDGEKDKADPVTTHGAFLSYLHLRHLRIRDMKRTCLEVLNYFRSIERTLTINDQGLIGNEDSLQRGSFQNHRTGTDIDGSTGGGGGLGYHGYLHNNPADFKISESDFLQFSEVNNHDDFYMIEDEHLLVIDQKGYRIIYDKALDDLGHYIQNYSNLWSGSRGPLCGSRRPSLNQAGDFDIAAYAQEDVDRFGVLLDMWTNEAAFQECKRELLDCYFEVYQHVVDRDERRRLAQVITNIMHQRPRFDLQSDYFIQMYRAECAVLRQHVALVKSLLHQHMDSQRQYIHRVTRDPDTQMGLPHRIIPKQPVAVNLCRPVLKNVYMLEFHPTLAITSRIPAAVKHAYWELLEAHQPRSMWAAVLMEKKLLEVALTEWEALPGIGSSFSPQVHKDLFSDTFAEDPIFLSQLAISSLRQQEEVAGRRSHKEKQINMVQMFGRLMNIITLRHRLIEACWETEILSKVYKLQALKLGFPEFHLNLRFVQFEFASFKSEAGKPGPIFMTSIQEDDAAIDKYAPSYLYLAIHELDEGHVGRFSFRSRDGLLQVMRPGGMESLQVVLKAQVVHKNALIAAVQQVNICHAVKATESSGRASPTETKSEKSSTTQMTSLSSTATVTAAAGKLVPADSNKVKDTAEAFFSLQLEKSPSRDLMLNDFVVKKQQMVTALKNPEEMEKVKRKLISEYCEKFHVRLSLTSMRGQLLGYYNSIVNLLCRFPSVRDVYFVLGEAKKRQIDEDDMDDLTTDARMVKKRPRRLLSRDGQHVLNLWFIPHHTEVLLLYKTLDDSVCSQALAYSLSIVAALHDILHYLSVHASLGNPQSTKASHPSESVFTNWGVTERIGSELREIQKEIQHLPEPTSPPCVLELLTLRRDVMFLQFDMAVRYCMRDTFLSTNNMAAYKNITSNAQYALTYISSAQKPGLLSTYLTIPEPLESRDLTARVLFPWRSFINSFGPYPVAFGQWFLIESLMNTCLAGLGQTDRYVAGGEVLGVSLLMEDVLQSGSLATVSYPELKSQAQGQGLSQGDTTEQSLSNIGHNVISELKPARSAIAIRRHMYYLGEKRSRLQCSKRLSYLYSSRPTGKEDQHRLSRVQQPIDSYRLLLFFLSAWKCLENLKLDWGQKKLLVEQIDNARVYREFCKVYKTEILLPSLQSVARRLGQADSYDNLVLDTDIFVMPRGASELEVKLKQLSRLLENLECHLITGARKQVSREMTLAVAERTREEDALPTDLWKRAVMKESLTLNRPHIAEKFVNLLMSEVEETETKVTFDCRHLQSCLSELARSVMMRERHNFDSYSTYYENMLRTHQQLLFHREQEIQHLKYQLKQTHSDLKVSVQCQLANETHDLLMEVTALRAKVMEMRELSLTQERDIRERVKEEYENLIHNIFNSTFMLRGKFDEFRNDLQDDVMDKLTETRREAVDALSKLRLKFTGNLDKEQLQAAVDEVDQIRTLQHENHLLTKALLKLKAINTWKQNIKSQNILKTMSELRKSAETSKKEYLELQILVEEEVILLRQEIVALRQALTSTDKHCSEVRKVLQKEMKVKAERQHEEAERKRNKQQLEQVKQFSVDQLVEELTDKDLKLKKLESELDRCSKRTQMEHERAKRDVGALKKQSSVERQLKLDAFQLVDILQSKVYDLEACLTNRPSTGQGSGFSAQRTRSSSAHASRHSRPSSGGTAWPPTVRHLTRRSLTPFVELPADTAILNSQVTSIQRPKTVGGRLRSRISELLLNDLEPETQGRLLPPG